MIMLRTRRSLSVACRYYRDRLSVPRGPCNISVLRECWVHGVIDDGTLVWGQGLIDWLPVKNVRTLVPQIRTVEGTHLLAQMVKVFIKSGDGLSSYTRMMRCPVLHGNHCYHSSCRAQTDKLTSKCLLRRRHA